jgi:hypothetical protein
LLQSVAHPPQLGGKVAAGPDESGTRPYTRTHTHTQRERRTYTRAHPRTHAHTTDTYASTCACPVHIPEKAEGEGLKGGRDKVTLLEQAHGSIEQYWHRRNAARPQRPPPLRCLRPPKTHTHTREREYLCVSVSTGVAIGRGRQCAAAADTNAYTHACTHTHTRRNTRIHTMAGTRYARIAAHSAA